MMRKEVIGVQLDAKNKKVLAVRTEDEPLLNRQKFLLDISLNGTVYYVMIDGNPHEFKVSMDGSQFDEPTFDLLERARQL